MSEAPILPSGADAPIRSVAPWWLLLTGSAAFGIAIWLRGLAIPVAWALLAIAVLAAVSARRGRAGKLGLVAATLLIATLGGGLLILRHLSRIEHSWDSYAGQVAQGGVERLEVAVGDEVAALDRLAKAALAAPGDAAGAFRYFEALGSPPPHRGVVVSDRGGPIAWSGSHRAPQSPAVGTSTIEWTPFYVVVRRVLRNDSRVAIADAVVHAEPPADRIGGALDRSLDLDTELAGFAYRADSGAGTGWHRIPAGDGSLFVQPVLLSQGEAIQRVSERTRVWGGTGLLLAALVLIVVAWRRPASLTQRFLTLAAVIGAVAIVPFSAYSNQASIFDPGVYYASVLGPLSGSVAALTATSAVALLGFFALGRAGVRVRGGLWLPAIGVLAVASLGPFLLRDLARGIALPGQGAPIRLWLSWQVPLFLASAATLLAGASAGRILLARGRGGNPWLAPVLAALASVLAPLLWLAPGRWPGWYIVLWIGAMASLALARRSRALVVSAGIVAACGATTLVWYAVSRARVQLAETDVARLSTPDPGTVELTMRLAESLRTQEPPRERADLLRTFVESPLAAAGQPVELASWGPGEQEPHAELRLRGFAIRVDGELDIVNQARTTGEVVWRLAESGQGRQMLGAVPHADGSVTTIVVAPQSRLVEEDQFSHLSGLSRPSASEPPYDIVLTTLPSPVPVSERPQWARKGNELHGDWLVPGAGDGARAHVEVELRGLDVLIPRGALMVLVDLLLLGVLWTLVAAADGGLLRWSHARLGSWSRSYRGRLTVTLFAFFMIPAASFALWSYSRLIQSDRESRVLLVRETLRAVTRLGGGADLGAVSDRFETPLLAYRGGYLTRASDSLYTQLAPVGLYLPPDVAIGLGAESEVTTTARPSVAGVPLLFGYRSFAMTGGGRGVLAAPARLTERALDRERRDIGVLVLFAASLGALAALGLSGLAARELERPVGALRLAALRIARGERYPAPQRPPAQEFVPVFSAFERMDTELAASRDALENAQRRTASVLRDVPSGVIAIDPAGHVMLANPGADALLGRPVTPGLTLREIGDVALAERVEAFLAGSRTEDAFDLVVAGRQVRGSLAPLERGTGGAVLTLEDVTDLARAQRVLAWGEMARQVAHEIKNPLTPIRLGVQHLRRARGDDRVDFARIFEQNVERILAEIDRLDEIARAFSRYGMSPAERLDPVTVDVAAITRDVVDLERMGVDGIAWHVTSPSGPVEALAREDELREVLLNVMENARQARATRIDIEVRQDNGHVEIVVRDDGDGVLPEDLERIFEPRFSTRTSGSGLGLAISRGMVEAWGGRMLAERDDGRGTVMRISLAAARGR